MHTLYWRIFHPIPNLCPEEEPVSLSDWNRCLAKLITDIFQANNRWHYPQNGIWNSPSKTNYIVSAWKWKIMKPETCTMFWSIKTFCIWQIHWMLLLSNDWPCCLACPSAGWSGADCEGRGQTPAGQCHWTPGTVPTDNHHTTTSAQGCCTPAGMLINTCWAAALTPSRLLHWHLAGCCIDT